MYKYSKMVKEEFFRDNVMAFYWLFFRVQTDFSTTINELEDPSLENQDKKPASVKDPEMETQIIPVILQEYDMLAWNTVQSGNKVLLEYINTSMYFKF